MAVTYSEQFFDEMEEANLASARVVVPLLLEFVPAKSVVDIGCGRGLWLKAFVDKGVDDVQGYDGEYVEREKLAISVERFHAVDLEQPIEVSKTFDLVVCLEVGEHLPHTFADTLVKNLTGAAPVILFSAAIPLQGGSHHVNEQWPEYWANKFAVHGYVPVDAIRRHIWDDSRVSFFYAQNILVYVKESELAHYPELQKEIEMGHSKALALVHPFIFTYYAERWRMVVPFLGKLPPSFLHSIKKFLIRFR